MLGILTKLMTSLLWISLVTCANPSTQPPKRESGGDSSIKLLKWLDCGGANASVRWEDVRIQEPMRLRNLTIGASYTITKEVTPGSTSKVEVWRLMRMLFMPVQIRIPCTNKFGSCDYDICRVADYDNFCNFQRFNNGSCGCPMAPNKVVGYNFRVRVAERKLTSFQSYFAEGIYRLRWTWYNPQGQRIACLEGEGPVSPFQ